MKTGQIVKFSNPLNDSEEAERFIVRELRGTNVLVEFIGNMRIKPSFVYPLKDFTIITLDQTIAQMKREILQDVRVGFVPKTVTSFSALHDYRDVNSYGGFCDDAYADAFIEYFGGRDEHKGMPDGFMKYMNDAQNAVNEWL